MQSFHFEWFVLIRVFWFLSAGAIFGVLSYVTEPKIQDLSDGHTTIDKDINLECTVTCDKPNVLVEWSAPINLNLTADRVHVSTSETLNLTLYVTRSTYTITRSRSEDSSIYYCRTTDPENPFNTKYTYIWVPIYNTSEHIIEFDKNHVLLDKTNTELQVYVRAHPRSTFFWVDKNNNTIPSASTKFTVLTTPSNRLGNYKTVLKFNTVSVEDFGEYTIVARNQYENKTFPVLVNLTGPPSTSLKVEKYDEDSYVIRCQSVGFPKPTITWQFENCNGLSCFEEKAHKNIKNVTEMTEFKLEENGLQTISYILVNKSDVGMVRGVGENTFGSDSSVQHSYNVENGFEVFVRNMIKDKNTVTVEALFHENIEMVCAVSLKDYHHEIKWYRQGRNMSLDDIRVPIRGFDEYHIKNFDAIYSSVSVVKVNIDKTDEGNYFCKASTRSGKIVTKIIKLIARELPVLNVASNMQNKTALVKYGNSWKFYCNVDGYPKPLIEWYKNNLTVTSSSKMQIKNKNQTLEINDIGPKDNGTYRCEITNRHNQKLARFATLGAIENDFDWLLIVIITLAIVLTGITAIMVVKVRKENKIKQELKLVGLSNFEKGDVDSINPQLTVGDQAELLPYDKKWEIPKENLKLGKELGSGAFGVVVKGELSGIPTKESKTTVAVKTVNKFAGYDCIRALASELKIMVHLGRHVNIVNLIGACTTDVMKKKLLVVVEYCSFGNLQEHILHNSNRFIDQRTEDKCGFDWTIGPKSPEKEKNVSELQYTTLSFTNDSCNSDYIVSTRNSKGEDLKYICSQDLLVWAFQVSRGMEYLASRNVLHGDLAARNVLLSEDNVVKISDFGLARSMYKEGIYKKKQNGPLPVKWMAVESIGENIFSTQSDVWSFGVLLWEFFSLAKTPYPGMPIDQNFYSKIFSGYRMEIPYFATSEIYEIMIECWNETPIKRPSFTQLAEKFGLILEDPVKEHYLNMNGSYVSMSNNQSESNSATDYLSLMSSPNIENTLPSIPNYLSNINYFRPYENNVAYISDKTDHSDRHNNVYVKS